MSVEVRREKAWSRRRTTRRRDAGYFFVLSYRYLALTKVEPEHFVGVRNKL